MSEEVVKHEILDNLKPDEDDSLFDPKIIEEINKTETPPAFASEEWHEYVMSQFLDDELDNSSPIRDGLVRVTEKIIGPIMEKRIVNYTPPSDSNRGTSTVHISLHIFVKNSQHPLYRKIIVEDGIAEVNSRNTPAPFHLHPSATASSKAEAQALRKVLRLRKMVAADEKTPDDMVLDGDVFVPETPITEEQRTVIDMLCRRINIDVLDFINAGQIKYVFTSQIPSHTAQTMIKFLSEIQSGKKEKPQLKIYNPAWRQVESKRFSNDESPTES